MSTHQVFTSLRLFFGAARKPAPWQHVAACPKVLLWLLLFAGLLANSARATILIDDFTLPLPGEPFVIGLLNPDPYVVNQSGGVGGQRDLLVDVLGAPSAISAVGTIGNGSFTFGTTGSSPAMVVLQYDGIDVDPATSLNNVQGLNLDLTSGEGQYYFGLLFRSVDSAAANGLNVRITATSVGASATYVGSIPNADFGIAFWVFAGEFVPTGPFDPQAVTSLQFALNEDGVPNIDFDLDSIVLRHVPEPNSAILLVGGMLTTFGLAWRRKR